MLSGFYHGLREMDKETKECLSPLLYNNEKKILFIISAVKTSKSLENIKKAINREGLQEEVNYLALYRLIKQDIVDFLCDLSGDFSEQNNIRFESKQAPDPTEIVVPIDEQSFFPNEVKDDLVEIKKAGADFSKDFFELYSGKNIISIHRDAFFFNNTPLRHHGIFVDVSKMLDCETFIEKFNVKIAQLPQLPACIIYPPHEQGEKFTNLVCDFIKAKYGVIPQIFCFSKIELETEKTQKTIIAFLQNLIETDLILVIDDVSITGNRIHSYQKFLHNKYIGKIHYLVGVARPTSDDAWERRKKIIKVTSNYTIDYVEKIILPNWDRESCPWCQEKQLLKEIIDNVKYENLQITEKLKSRLNDLNRAEKRGLLDDAFLSLRSKDKPPFMGLSIFCREKNISEADMIASVASTIQHLRNGFTNSKDGISYKLHVGYPIFSVIHMDDYLKGNEKFFEPFIKASIIRCASHQELYTTEDHNRQLQKRYLESFFRGENLSETEASFFIYELFIAIKTGKLPKPNTNKKLREIIETYCTSGTFST